MNLKLSAFINYSGYSLKMYFSRTPVSRFSIDTFSMYAKFLFDNKNGSQLEFSFNQLFGLIEKNRYSV